MAPHVGAMKIEGSWSEGVRFSRADGSLTGAAGGPGASAGSEPTRLEPTVADLDDASRADASRDDASRDDAKVEPSLPEQAAVDPSQARDALLALKRLEFPAPRATALLRGVLAEQPAARAEERVRAVLRRHSA